jgi:hypothetical protein
MEFYTIEKSDKVYPGEYLLHLPSKQVVVCGAYKPNDGSIRALVSGRLLEDKIENFHKIKLEPTERKPRPKRKCGGCKG